MICQEFCNVAMLLFSNPEKNYDGTQACTMMKWNKIISILDKIEHRGYERRVMNYLRDYYQDEHVAPSIHLWHTWIVTQFHADSTLPKAVDAPESYEEDDLRSLSQAYQLGCIYNPGDLAGLTEQWIRAIQLNSWTQVAMNASGEIYSGKAFNEIKKDTEGLLADLAGANSDLSLWDHTQTPEEVMAAYDEQLRLFAAHRPVRSSYAAIDKAYRGLRPGDFMTVLGASGHGKSTLSMNLAYNALLEGHSGAYISLEMQEREIKYRFYCMHSTHPKFKAIHPLVPFMDLANGELNVNQRAFLKDYVIKDFHTLPGRLAIIDSSKAGLTIPEVEQALLTFDNMDYPFQYFVLDSPNLLDIVHVKGLPEFKQIGQIYKSIKRICDSYKGTGIACIAPVQANRDGIKAAEKNNGFFGDLAFADSQDIYRSSSQSVAISSFDWMKEESHCMIHGLKARWGKTPSAWTYDVCPETGRITDAGIPPVPKPKESTVAEEGDSYAAKIRKAKACATSAISPMPSIPIPTFKI